MHSKVDIKLQTTELTTSEIIEMFNISTKNATNLLSHLKKCFGGSYNPNSKYLIAIQGSSSSGKSTIANNLNRLLNACGIESYLLEIDKYYKTFETPNNCENTEEYVKSYDFDNPAAIDWTKVYGVLKAIEQDAEYLPTYDYSFITKKSNGPIKIKNKYPKVVIVEGIYAMNTISEQIFNVEMFDAFNSAKEIKKEFVKNKNLLLGYNKIKLRLTMCKHKSQRVRTGRDVLQRGKTKEMATYQFLNQVWPATTKWVNNINFKEDIKIVHGSFNNKKLRVMLALFTFYFTGKYTIYKEAKYNTDCFEDFSVECSGECSKKSSFCIVLDDT
ncbi:Uridine kinase [Binucleata daphniae]